ncbi:restriction endonuclease [Chloroflexus sp.]|uniref:restriction endonuclease n=1 Tax=Chloroflexus sp. TaxID=1904827 RepID=UPI00260D8EC6|nr:restriction endonuclease [uncultured Chloroflexus sp.]
MSIPDFQTLMLPLLRALADGQEHAIRDLVNHLATEFQLTEAELSQLIPSGKQPLFYNRVGWARTYLVKAGLLEMTRRATYRITARGQQVLASNPPRIDIQFLEQFPEYRRFREGDRDQEREREFPQRVSPDRTPQELLEAAYQEIRDSLAQELLTLVKQCSPVFFEQLVVELLVKMGYGGSHRDAARAVGQVGDEGIDGVIDEDRLGLDRIYIQAKRWDTVVGRPEIQKFAGALMGKRARKGVFITTASFSEEARRYAESIDYNIVLIDGKRLADLMIDYNVGVTIVSTYHLKRIDSDYFGNE